MSKGMKSKMMLATALAHTPKLLVLDEITSGLDPVVRDDILHILAILPTVGTLIMKKTGIKLSTIALTPQTIVMLCLGGILVIEFVSFMLSIKIRKKRE